MLFRSQGLARGQLRVYVPFCQACVVCAGFSVFLPPEPPPLPFRKFGIYQGTNIFFLSRITSLSLSFSLSENPSDTSSNSVIILLVFFLLLFLSHLASIPPTHLQLLGKHRDTHTLTLTHACIRALHCMHITAAPIPQI